MAVPAFRNDVRGLGGVECEDHIVGNVRLVGNWLQRLRDIGPNRRRQTAPEPRCGCVLVLEADFPAPWVSANRRFGRCSADALAALRSDDEELVKTARATRESADEREPDRPGWPIDDVCDPVRIRSEIRLKMASLERAVFVWMRVPEL